MNVVIGLENTEVTSFSYSYSPQEKTGTLATTMTGQLPAKEQERNCQGKEEKHVQLQQLMAMHLLDLQQAPLHKTIFPRIGGVRACKTGPVHLPIEVISRVNAISSA